MTPLELTPPRPLRNAVRGFTLVELMIALTLGLLIVAGVTSLFIGMRASYSFQDGLSRVQENGRFAIQTLGRGLRMSGFTGCTNNIVNWLNPAGTGYVTSIYGNRAVTGWEATGTGPGDNYTVGDASNWQSSSGEGLAAEINNPLSGSDIVVINTTEPLDVVLQGNPGPPANALTAAGNTGIPQGAIIVAVTASCSGGDLFMKTSDGNAVSLPKGTAAGQNPGNINPAGGFSQDHDDNSLIYQHLSTAYFVRNNPATPPEPALYRLRLDDARRTGTPNPQELVSGIENMQILYGEDTDGDRTANTYRAADSVVSWNRVVSVRMALLLRNDSFVQTESDLRAFDVAYTNVTPVEDGRVRQVMTLTVALRNRLP
ncbi:PilW family protein [Algiphilus aromaticivorans]|uniref:PilW family protein n=1 Tax=Algiphilus aromaticivorans TaxID=382454 RepID=UPI0006947F6D|nr:PilW family protein [Algiphilus aromaticivorans]